MAKHGKKRSLSTFLILLLVLLAVSAVTWMAAGNTYTDAETGALLTVSGASLSDTLMAGTTPETSSPSSSPWVPSSPCSTPPEPWRPASTCW